MTMFSKVKNAKQKEELTKLLAFVVAGTLGATGNCVAPAALVNEIVKQESTFLKLHGEPDAVGNVLVSATAEGIAASTGKPVEASNGAAPKVSPFKLEQGIAVPANKRGGIKGDTYPFESMQKDDSFFVAATEAKPNPTKSLASTVSSANKRYATTYPTNHKTKAGQPTGKDGRTFTVRARTVADGEVSNGARVWRIS